jgi:hypothetical protein
MLPGAKSHDLLYISDIEAREVDVFSYPDDKLVGVLEGFAAPDGLCTDARADVYVMDRDAHRIVEYPHGGIHALRTIHEAHQLVTACDVNPAGGDLAVTSNPDDGGPGYLFVYTKAKGPPHIFEDKGLISIAYCVYDEFGNLFVDGRPKHGNFALQQLAPLGLFNRITMQLFIQGPGGMRRLHHDFAIGDSNDGFVYQVAINAHVATKVGATLLRDAAGIHGFAIDGDNDAIVSEEYAQYAGVDRWNYPAGGNPVKRILGFKLPIGIALSP